VARLHVPRGTERRFLLRLPTPTEPVAPGSTPPGYIECSSNWKCDPTMMQRLPGLYRAPQGEFAAMFLDIMDARLSVTAPLLAEKAKTKEGVIERKIDVVLSSCCATIVAGRGRTFFAELRRIARRYRSPIATKAAP
jgi:hypothetical protein